jgi:hypothetical protein
MGLLISHRSQRLSIEALTRWSLDQVIDTSRIAYLKSNSICQFLFMQNVNLGHLRRDILGTKMTKAWSAGLMETSGVTSSDTSLGTKGSVFLSKP